MYANYQIRLMRSKIKAKMCAGLTFLDHAVQYHAIYCRKLVTVTNKLPIGVRNYSLQKDCLGSKVVFVDIVVLFDIVRQQKKDLLQVNGKLRRESAADFLSYLQSVQYITQMLDKQLYQQTRQFTPWNG